MVNLRQLRRQSANTQQNDQIKLAPVQLAVSVTRTHLGRARTHALTPPPPSIPASAVNKSANAEEQFGNSAHAFPLTPFFTPSSNLASFQPGPVTPPRLKEAMNHLNQSGGGGGAFSLAKPLFPPPPSPPLSPLRAPNARRDHDVPLRADFTAFARSLAPNTKLARNRQGKEGRTRAREGQGRRGRKDHPADPAIRQNQQMAPKMPVPARVILTPVVSCTCGGGNGTLAVAIWQSVRQGPMRRQT